MDRTYAETLAELYARTNHGVKLGLETMRALLDALGRPEQSMAHVVVAGTNGKGSTSLLIATALRHAGHRVGHFTSPHLLRFTERIRIDDREIAPGDVVRLVPRVLAAERAAPRPATFFELVTALALVAFAEAGVRISVLEVGMGGRLDATNTVNKELAVITRVDLDHQQYLGATLAAIAGEKAGIIPQGGTVVVGSQHPEAFAVIRATAAERRSRLVAAPTPRFEAQGLVLALPNAEPLALRRWPAGAYQRDNVSTAATAVTELARHGWACPPQAIAQAAADFVWPGRYQWIEGVPECLLDGAHNPGGIRALHAAMAEDPRVGDRPVHVVATVLQDRPAHEMVPLLAARAATLHLCPVPSSRSRSMPELAALDPRARVHPSVAVGLEAAGAAARADGGLVLACGSLFLVAEALTVLTGAPRDPPVDG